MIERTYMGIDMRRDHSFRVLRPDLAATGSPDACTDCHGDRDAAELASRFPDSVHRGPHHATTFAAARRDPQAETPLLLDLAEWAGGPGVRATALDPLGAVADKGAAERVTRFFADPDPLVGAAAAGALRSLPPDDRLARLETVLSDPRRAVREASARALADERPDPSTPRGAALMLPASMVGRPDPARRFPRDSSSDR